MFKLMQKKIFTILHMKVRLSGPMINLYELLELMLDLDMIIVFIISYK